MVILALPAPVRHPPTSYPRLRHRPWTTIAAAPRKSGKTNRKVEILKEVRSSKKEAVATKAATRTKTVRICVEDPDATDDGSTDNDGGGAVTKRRKVQIFKASVAYYDDKQVSKRGNEKKISVRNESAAMVIDIPGPVPDIDQIMEKASALLLSFFDDLPDD